MRKRESLFRSPMRSGTKSHSHSRDAPKLFAAEDIQQFKVGSEILYVSKAWIGVGSVWSGVSSGAKIELPQSGIVEVATLGMRPRPQWQLPSFGPLPMFINIVRSPATSVLPERSKVYAERLFDLARHYNENISVMFKLGNEFLYTQTRKTFFNAERAQHGTMRGDAAIAKEPCYD